MSTADLYAQTDRPYWAGGQYQCTVMKNRAFNYQVTNKRSHDRDIEFSLPSELAKGGALDRALPVLIDADTDPMMQVAGVFVGESGSGLSVFLEVKRGKNGRDHFCQVRPN